MNKTLITTILVLNELSTQIKVYLKKENKNQKINYMINIKKLFHF